MVRGLFALAGGLVSLSLGFPWGSLRGDQWEAQDWRSRLAPLERVPIPTGSRVLLLPPAECAPQEARFWGCEARFLRPDLLWAEADEWPVGEAPTWGVVTSAISVPEDCLEVWRSGEFRLLTRRPAKAK
jgi:hypothetical protein